MECRGGSKTRPYTVRRYDPCLMLVATLSYQPLLRSASYLPPGQLGTCVVMMLVNCDCSSFGSMDQSIAGKPPMSLTTETCSSGVSMKLMKSSAPCRFLAFFGTDQGA